ncbi:MAG: 1-deoxy-D-xylulose-5-phosphate reductoisomerase [Phycisphaerales bacterium]|nr:1-deoxy-D-xylulose-5-phosphate reductoisomerase [Phycisphaerales bacterium]
MRSTRRLIVLGSTGSIGENTLTVVRHLAREESIAFEVVGLAAARNGAALAAQARELGPLAVALADVNAALPDLPTGIRIHRGPTAAVELVKETARPGDLVLAAIVGSAGIAPVLAAIEMGCDIALANKEALVAAGAIVTARARERGVRIIPVDSEHSAIAQCLRSGDPAAEVRRIVLTASGGPFRQASVETIERATLADALKHPTWTMGQKVTIDSATMMNKALEIVEAHWLFGLDAERIDAIVHPASIVHSFVEFVDGSVIAQMSPPDMRLPIQFALTWPRRAPLCCTPLDWASLRTLDFHPIDHQRFPAVALAGQVIRAGGTSGAILNGANEAAVEAFVAGRIRFGQISRLVAAALAAIPAVPALTLNDVSGADSAARAFVASEISPNLPKWRCSTQA